MCTTTISDKITIFHRELTKDGAVWTSIVYEPFRMFIKNTIRSSDDSEHESSIAHLRIKTDRSICSLGDMIVMGEIKADAPGDNAWEIFTLTENFHCSEHSQHVNIMAGR